MKRMGLDGVGDSSMGRQKPCAKSESVRNIRNIQICKKNNQSIQLVTRKNLFRKHQNKPEHTGTFLFGHVPAMFRQGISTRTGHKPSATVVSANHPKSVFWNVPVVPEQIQKTGSPESRGLQPSHYARVPDVPDQAGAYASFHFSPVTSPAPGARYG